MTTRGAILAWMGGVVLLAVMGFAGVAPSQAEGSRASGAKVAGGVGERAGDADAADEIEKLTEEVRQLKRQLSGLRSNYRAMENHLLLAPTLEAQTQDYAQARTQF